MTILCTLASTLGGDDLSHPKTTNIKKIIDPVVLFLCYRTPSTVDYQVHV